jgi:uncharacterized BrkB/YihY/UPF0761 family membrane protein
MWFMLLFRVWGSILSRSDLSGLGKTGWLRRGSRTFLGKGCGGRRPSLMMSEPHNQESDHSEVRGVSVEEQGFFGRVRARMASGTVKARSAGDRHVSIAVPFRAAERNRRVAASVLAGGLAYRIFVWLLPFSLIVGGALGLGNADSIEHAVSSGGLPQAVVNAIGDIARSADSSWWWLLAVGVPLLLWAGYSGAKAFQLIHSLVWNEPPPRTDPLISSLVFTGGCCAFVAAISLTWWLRDAPALGQVLVLVIMIAPLAAFWLLVSLRLPHGTSPWKSLLPGALLVAIGFQVLHGMVLYLLVPKLEKSTSLYGGLGAVATLLFFMYVVGRIVVTAPILNAALHDELQEQGSDGGCVEPTVPEGN